MPYSITTLTFRCPKCQKIIKRENDSLICLLGGMIANLINPKKEIWNDEGEQIVHCSKCESVVAISSCGGMFGSSRIITPEKEILEMMMPIIKYLHDDFNISCDKYNNNKEYSELLGLIFKSSAKSQCKVFIKNIRGEMKMHFENEEYEPLNIKKLGFRVIKTLLLITD